VFGAAAASFTIALILASPGPDPGCDTGTAYIPPCHYPARVLWWAPGVVLYGTPFFTLIAGCLWAVWISFRPTARRRIPTIRNDA
jgi:hypothetical protein